MEAGLGIGLRGLTSWRTMSLSYRIRSVKLEELEAGMARGFAERRFPLRYRESCDFPGRRLAWLSPD
jgi:hypothetical protein